LWRSALWLLLAGVLAGRVAAMPGWMPVAGPDGIEVALCNGGTMVMPLGKSEMPADHKGSHDCPFAGAAHGGGLADDVATLTPPVLIPALAPVTRLTAIVPGRALALPPSTGPPALA
jgi:hypothetical protein